MPSRPSLTDVRLVAEGILAADGHTNPAMLAVPALRMGGGTREGQAQVNLLLATAFADILERECPTDWRTPLGIPDMARLTAVDDERQVADGYMREKRRTASRPDRRTARRHWPPRRTRRCSHSSTSPYSGRSRIGSDNSSLRRSGQPGS
ncbi:hypothetical protein ACH40E_38025 [Streptomyces acidicola]|uniref:hypothetical protein n=1 Tax=Streptomyces acidicola TaxID=2596892 RepID=UPI0037B0379A